MTNEDRNIGLWDYTEIEEPDETDWDAVDDYLDALEDLAYQRAVDRRLFRDDE